MNKSTLNLALSGIALSMGVAIASSFLIPLLTPVFGQAVEPTSRINFEPPSGEPNFEPPPNQPGAPGQTGAGGTRGECFPKQKEPDPSLTLLIPVKQRVLTVAEHPTFFVYVPPTLAQTAQLVLKEKISANESKVIDEAKFPLSGTPGIVSVRMPDNATKLEIGKNYRWSFALICNPTDRGVDRIEFGTIERTELNPNLAKELETATPLERANLYAKNGIWQDAIAILFELRHSQPDNSNVKVIWEELLQSEPVKLNKVAKEPLVECCQAEKPPLQNQN